MSKRYEIRVHHLLLYQNAAQDGAYLAALNLMLGYKSDLVQLNKKRQTRYTDISQHTSVISYRDMIGEPDMAYLSNSGANPSLTEAESLFQQNLKKVFQIFLTLNPSSLIKLITSGKDPFCQTAAQGNHCNDPTYQEHVSPEFELSLLYRLLPKIPELKIANTSSVYGLITKFDLLEFLKKTSREELGEILYPTNFSALQVEPQTA